MARHMIAPLKVYRLISGIFDDNSGKEYIPGDEIVTNRNIEQDPNNKVEYLGVFNKDQGSSDHLEVIWKGGPRWGVYSKLTGEKIHNGWLTKEEAIQIEAANEEA